MGAPTKPPANGFVRYARKVYNPIGFSKGYNFPLFVIFAGALMGFSLSRFYYLDFNGVFCSGKSIGASPGECYYYVQNFYKIGIILHLATIMPAGFQLPRLLPVRAHHPLQSPALPPHQRLHHPAARSCRERWRSHGARRAFGGDLSTQSWIGVLAIMTTIGLGLAYYNIKRLQIDQHRAWMLRTWFYMGSIITIRLILMPTNTIISKIGSYYHALPCYKIAFIYGEDGTYALHPECGVLRGSTI